LSEAYNLGFKSNVRRLFRMPRKKATRARAKSRRKATKPKKLDGLAALSQHVKDVGSNLQVALKELREKIGEFPDRVEFESRISEMQSRVLESIPKMEAEMKSFETKLARAVQKPELETRLAELEQRLASLAAEIEAVKGRVKDLEVPEV
jgi:predicted  nucleic acid-binding Zn-ribbon protein